MFSCHIRHVKILNLLAIVGRIALFQPFSHDANHRVHPAVLQPMDFS